MQKSIQTKFIGAVDDKRLNGAIGKGDFRRGHELTFSLIYLSIPGQ